MLQRNSYFNRIYELKYYDKNHKRNFLHNKC